jgi:hypothetical protein
LEFLLVFELLVEFAQAGGSVVVGDSRGNQAGRGSDRVRDGPLRGAVLVV